MWQKYDEKRNSAKISAPNCANGRGLRRAKARSCPFAAVVIHLQGERGKEARHAQETARSKAGRLPAWRRDVRAFFRLWLAGRARRGHLGGGRAAGRGAARLADCGAARRAAGAWLYARAEAGKNIPRGAGVRVHAGLLCADVLRRVPRFVRLRCAVPTAAGGHGCVFDASSAAAHAGAGRAAAAWPRAGRYQPRRGAVYRAANGAAGGMLCADLRLDCAAVRRAGGEARGSLFRALSAEHGDGGERDEGRAVRRLFGADAGASERDSGKAVARADAENRGLRRAGGDAAQQHGVCRAGVAGAPDARPAQREKKRGAGHAAGAGRRPLRKRGAETRDPRGERRHERNALLADSAACPRAAV